MLKVLGTIYADNQENFEEIKKYINDTGLIIAYRSQASGDIIQEIPDPEEPSEES